MRKTRLQPYLLPLDNRILLNSTPVLGPLPPQFVQEGKTFAVNITANDPDNDPITYSLAPEGAPSGATIDTNSGLLLWKPPEVQQVVYIPVIASDNNNHSTAGNLTVWIFDSPPTVNAGVNETLTPGDFSRAGFFTDANESDTHHAIVTYGDGSGIFILALNPDKSFNLNHTYNSPGQYTVIVTIYDNQGGQGIGAFSITVQDKQPDPIMTPPLTPAPIPTTVTTILGPNQVKKQPGVVRQITYKKPRFSIPRFITNLHKKH
jgi:hypothetical protein